MAKLDKCTCKEAFDRLDCYVDRELDESEIQAVQAHLEKCEECALEYEFEERVLEEMREKLNRVAVPSHLRDRVFARLRQMTGDVGE